METTAYNSLQSVRLFNRGFHCSQAVQAGNGLKEVDPVLLKRVCSDIEKRYGQGNLCGALLGGLMVLHTRLKNDKPNDKTPATIQRLQKTFVDSFATKCDSVFCQHLLNRNVDENKLAELENKIGRRVKQCSVYVHRACVMINNFLQEEKLN